MDTEIIIFVGVFVGLCSIIWGVLGYVYRDDAESGDKARSVRETPPAAPVISSDAGNAWGATPPPHPVAGSEHSAPAPKLKLNRPLPPPPPVVASAPRNAEGAGAAPQFTLTTQPAVRVLPSGFTYHGVVVLGRGLAPWKTSSGYRLVFQIVDFEHAIEGPLYCPVLGYGDPLLGMIRFVSADEPPSPGILADWTELAFLPTSMFTGPKSGVRNLSLRCGIMRADGDAARSLQVGALVFKANLEMPGFLDGDLDLRILVSTRIVELAMACAAADGVSDACESQVILKWIEQWSERMDDGTLEHATRFRSSLLKVLSSAARSSFTLDSAAHGLLAYAEGQRMEALALCVRVIASDGHLHAKEMSMAERLADLLQIDRSIMQSLFDKQFANSGIVASPDNLEAIVGIDPSWNKDKIRRHLAGQFMKWNSRAPAAKTVEDQARIRAMLDAIAKLKHKYA